MIQLQVLGGMELRAANGRELQSVLAQPKRQALLVYLAVAKPRGFHRRETLLALFWPEFDDAHARAALSRAMHYLRQSLGSEVVLSRGHDEVGLDWSRLWCDAAGFEEALDRGDTAEGLALYRGDLLPGFYVDDAAEFESWLASARAELRGRAVKAALLLSEREEVAGRMSGAVEWARRAAQLAPFDEPTTRRLIGLLDAMGDRAGALRTYEELAERFRAELDAEPAPETVAQVQAIRARPAGPIVQPMSPSAVVAEPAIPPAAAPRARKRSGRLVPWGVGALVAGALVFATLSLPGRTTVAPSGATAAVVPFAVAGDSSGRYLGNGMVSLLTERLNQGGELRAIDARAVLNAMRNGPAVDDPGDARARLGRLHARFVILGRVEAARDSVWITATLFDSVYVEMAPRGAVSGPASDVARLVDDLAWQLMVAKPTGNARLHRPIKSALTPSLDALKLYLAGDAAYAAGHFREATRAYRAAVEADTTFALAYLWLSRSANWQNDPATTSWASTRALQYMDRLALLDRFRVRAWNAYQYGRVQQAERLYQVVLANDVSAADAWLTIGEIRFHWGPLLGWTLPQAREAFERAVAISTRDAGSVIHLARIAAAQDRRAALDSLVALATAQGVDTLQAVELDGLRAFNGGTPQQRADVLAALRGFDDDAALGAVVAIAAANAQHQDTRALAEVLTSAERPAAVRAIGALLDAQLAMAQGQWSEARSALERTDALTRGRALEYRVALATLPFHAAQETELRGLRAELSSLAEDPLIGPWIYHYSVAGIYIPRRRYLIGMLDLQLGDTAAVQNAARTLDAIVADDVNREYGRMGARLLRAELLRKRGRPEQALVELGAPGVLPDRVLPNALAYASAHERFLRAELLRELDRPREALQWLETFPDPAGYDLMYLAPVYFRRAEIQQRLGNREVARAEKRRAELLWRAADVSLWQTNTHAE